MKKMYIASLEFYQRRLVNCFHAITKAETIKDKRYWTKEMNKAQNKVEKLEKRCSKYLAQVIYVDFRSKKILNKVG